MYNKFVFARKQMGWCFIIFKITFDRWMKMDWNWLCGRRVHNIFLYFLKERSWVSLCGLIKSWHTNWKWLTNNKPWRKQWRSMQNCCWGFTVFPGDKFLWKSDTQSRDGKWKRTNLLLFRLQNISLEWLLVK